MCGIYGMVSLGDRELGNPEALERMGQLLRHRGPDGHGTVHVSRAAFGAERLRVIDPTPAGDQPFTDPTSRVWLVLNGAIYNAPELRRRYSDYPFRSRSDAETILPLYLERGSAGVADLDGMFALAIYDARTRELMLARDRAGEKPLFFSRRGDEIWFASEVQALLAGPVRIRALDAAAVHDFLTLGYVAEPRTLISQIRKVEAGTAVSFTRRGCHSLRYWDPDATARSRVSTHDAAQRLEQLLARAVTKQLTADVPIGIFTSGGVDSSLLAALAVQAVGAERVRTFSVGFAQRRFDESSHARRLATHLRTRHVSLQIDFATLSEALVAVVDRVAEPVADPAILPTYLLARVAREHVTVVLCGEGADELFGGYPTYLGHRAARWYRRLPAPLRTLTQRLTTALPGSQQRKVSLQYLLKRFTASAQQPLPVRHMEWFGTGLGRHLLRDNHWLAGQEARNFPDAGDAVDRATLFDYRTYLRDNLLPKVDRATMLSSLEARAPYLDGEVTRFALALDSSLKVRGTTTKWLLKQVARRWLPRTIVHRRKRGLSVPIAQWLNGDLRSEVDRLLSPERIERRGLLRPGTVSQLLTEHRSGHADHGRALWTLLMLEYWIERWVSEE